VRTTLEDIVMKFLVFILPVVIAAMIVLVIASMYASATGMHKGAVDVTDKYTLPPELADCRVYRLVSGGFGHSLYVVTRGGEPESVRYETGGKHSQGVSVALPVPPPDPR
jgi:hypothetical protein